MAVRSMRHDGVTGDDVVLRIVLRHGTIGDADAMAKIERSAFSDPWPVAGFADLLAATYARTVVAEYPVGEIAGYCIVIVAADEAEIANIAVAEERRRLGIGAQLLDVALAWVAHQGVKSVYLEVREANESARALYASRGFSQVGRRRSYYQHPVEDALVLRRLEPRCDESP